MKTFLRVSAITLVALALLVAAAWVGGRRYLARSVAPLAGEVIIAGPSAPIEILVDARGVPQVWAQTDADARFALGWLHAAERLFQMELTRRMARGELAELFGEQAAALDLEQRRLGFAWQVARDSATMPVEARTQIGDYVAGINAWIAQARPLPPEFVLLGFRPRPWTVEDVAVVGFYQSWFAVTLMDRSADHRVIYERLGGDAGRLANLVQQWSAPTVPEIARAVPKLTKASNSWVVAPKHSASGAALHASDPHLELSNAPGLWYAVGLHSAEGLEGVGVSAPGIPSISMGHNGEVSWAFTVAPVDLVDDSWYQVSGDRRQVTTARGKEPLTVQVESIAVKGEAPRVATILRAPKGPVMELRGDSARVQHWAGYDFPAWAVAVGSLGLMRATDFESFRRTVTSTGALSVNWTYADRAGNIGYQLGTPIPIRDGYDTFVPQSGIDPKVEWKGYRAFAERPFALNPAQGWLASTNNQVVGRGARYPIPGFYDVARMTRATELLDAVTGAGTPSPRTTNAEVMRTMQRDIVSGIGLRWRGLAIEAAESVGDTAAAQHLRRWQGRMHMTDTAATLFAYWWQHLPEAVFRDELGEEWPKGRHLVIAALEDSAGAFMDDRTTPVRETRREVAAVAMRKALAERWARPFGEVQTLTIRHPLAVIGVLDRWLGLTRGPFSSRGDAATLDAAFVEFDEERRGFHTIAGASMRFVLDWADVDGFTLSRHLGQSGNPLSPHFDDFLESHLIGEAWPMPFTRATVAERAVSTWTLRPAPAR